VDASNTLALVDGFEPAFYREFLQNGFESPDRLEPIRVLRKAFRVYLRTEDDAGRAIDAATLDTTERALIDSAAIWSGGTFDVQVERGTSTRDKVAGWITVKWSSVSIAGSCGRSSVGVDGGSIELDASGACSCGMVTTVYPRLVRHELGHAMGYYHTDSPTDVMYGRPISPDSCNLQPSERERRHARIAHESH
jgi:hypothetical protein